MLNITTHVHANDKAKAMLISKGKVRDVYDIGYNKLLIRHSNRVSSFDKIWCEIPGKGNILNSTSAWWFERTQHIIPNHLVHYWKGGKDMIVQKCEVFPIEFVVRGYITGTTNTSLWTHYSQGKREYCGVRFPDGLKKNQRLVQAVVTPTTKGDSDRPISAQEIIDSGIMTQEEWEYCHDKALELFKYGQKLAKGSGLILVDTKYEFGKDVKTQNIMLIDEIHTCDSSRYWKMDTYEARFQSGMEPERYDKDLIRTYVKTQCDPYQTKPSDVTIPSDIKTSVFKAYSEFYRTLTGELLFEDKLLNTASVQEICNRYYSCIHRNHVYLMFEDSELESKVKESLDKLQIYSEKDEGDLFCDIQYIIENIQKHTEHRNKKFVYITDDPIRAGIAASQGNISALTILCSMTKEDIDTQYLSRILDRYSIVRVSDPHNAAIAVDKIFSF